MIVIDTSVIYALLDRRDRRHGEAVGWYEGIEDDLATTPLVLAEIDHLVGVRAGATARAAFHRDLAAGAYEVHWWIGAEQACVEVAERYADLGVGLADASLLALAARLETSAIATFDERRFRAMRPLDGTRALQLLPLDSR